MIEDLMSAFPPRLDACRYPYGEVGTPGFRFCGLPGDETLPEERRSWCPEHRKVVFSPAPLVVIKPPWERDRR